MRSLLALSPQVASLVRSDGSEQEIPLSQVQAGDYLRVRPGATVPVDGVVAEGNSAVSQALITGESLPVKKAAGDPVIGGSINGNGSFIIMRAERVGKDTLLARIIMLVAKAQRTTTHAQRLADRVSSYFIPAVLACAFLTAIAWGLWGPEPRINYALVTSVAVLIIACPWALGLATPLSIVMAMGLGARAGILIRDARALEALENIDTLVIDKTGTLTEGKPRLLNIMPTEGHSETNLLRLAASLEQASGHPLSLPIVQAAAAKDIGLLKVHAFKSIPGKGITGIIDGRSVAIGNGALLETLGIHASLRTKAEPYKSQGQSVMYMAMDGHCIGLIMVADPIKPNAAETIKRLKASGLQVVMMTGDSPSTAIAVARKLGIERSEAEVTPERKAWLVRELQEKGHRVAMAGDGVNDAPALAQADVGIAMGNGTDIAMESAGITLLGGDLQGIIRAQRLSRATMRNIRQNLFFAFIYNGLSIPVAAGLLYPLWGLLLNPVIASAAMTASSVSVIANALRLRRTLL
jgi:P-type Cu+ transporter